MTSTIYTHTRFAEDIGRDHAVKVPPIAGYSPEVAYSLEDALIEKMKGMKRPKPAFVPYGPKPQDFTERRNAILVALAKRKMPTRSISALIDLSRCQTQRFLHKMREDGLIKYEPRVVANSVSSNCVWYWSLTEAAQ